MSTTKANGTMKIVKVIGLTVLGSLIATFVWAKFGSKILGKPENAPAELPVETD